MVHGTGAARSASSPPLLLRSGAVGAALGRAAERVGGPPARRAARGAGAGGVRRAGLVPTQSLNARRFPAYSVTVQFPFAGAAQGAGGCAVARAARLVLSCTVVYGSAAIAALVRVGGKRGGYECRRPCLWQFALVPRLRAGRRRGLTSFRHEGGVAPSRAWRIVPSPIERAARPLQNHRTSRACQGCSRSAGGQRHVGGR